MSLNNGYNLFRAPFRIQTIIGNGGPPPSVLIQNEAGGYSPFYGYEIAQAGNDLRLYGYLPQVSVPVLPPSINTNQIAGQFNPWCSPSYLPTPMPPMYVGAQDNFQGNHLLDLSLGSQFQYVAQQSGQTAFQQRVNSGNVYGNPGEPLSSSDLSSESSECSEGSNSHFDLSGDLSRETSQEPDVASPKPKRRKKKAKKKKRKGKNKNGTDANCQKRYGYQTKQKEIAKTMIWIKTFFGALDLLEENELVRGQDVLRINVKTFHGCRQMVEALKYINEQFKITRIAVVSSKKNKSQKKGCIVYLKVTPETVATCRDYIINTYGELTKCAIVDYAQAKADES